MGFLAGSFRVGDRVMVRTDTKSPAFVPFVGMIGVVDRVSRHFRTWHGSDVTYDYGYKLKLELPNFGADVSKERREDTQFRIRQAKNVWFPGRYLELAAVTMLIRQGRGQYRDTSEDGMDKADYVAPIPKEDK